MRNLETLTLARTAVTDLGIQALAGCTRLNELDFSDTEMTDMSLPVISALHELHSLDVSGTLLGPDALSHVQLRKIAKLELRGVSLSEKSLASLQHCRLLRTLDLNGASVTKEGIRYLAGMQQLEELVLSDENRELYLSAFAECPNLTCLVIGREDVFPQDLNALKSLRRLVELRLETAELSAEMLEILVKFPALQSLEARQLDDNGILILYRSKSLRNISVLESRVTADTLKHLRWARSDVSLKVNGTYVP